MKSMKFSNKIYSHDEAKVENFPKNISLEPIINIQKTGCNFSIQQNRKFYHTKLILPALIIITITFFFSFIIYMINLNGTPSGPIFNVNSSTTQEFDVKENLTTSSLIPYQNPENRTKLVNKIKKQITFEYPLTFDKIYYHINLRKYKYFLNNIEVNSSLMMLIAAIPAAASMGITDIAIQESSFNFKRRLTKIDISTLLLVSKQNSINVNLMLDTQFSIPKELSNTVPECFYKKNKLGNFIQLSGRYLYDLDNSMIEKHFQNYFKDLYDLGIKNYFLAENPKSLFKTDNNDFLPLGLINSEKLEKRFESIKRLGSDIKIYSCYSNEQDKNVIKSLKLEFDGSLLYIRNLDYMNLRLNAEFLTKIFERKLVRQILMFNFYITNSKIYHSKFLLGLYLFSPVPVMLGIEDENYHPYCMDIFSSSHDCQTVDEIEIRHKFIEIINIKRNDPYFSQESKLIGVVSNFDGVLGAMRAKNKNRMLFSIVIYLFNKKSYTKYVSLQEMFPANKFHSAKLLYTNWNVTIEGKFLDQSNVELHKEQLMIIKIIE